MTGSKQYAIGIDFGTDSVRTAMVSYDDGTVLATASCAYPRWATQQFCDSSRSQFRQHPADYQEALLKALLDLLDGFNAEIRLSIGSIAVGATGSTVAPVDFKGTPLALLPQFANDPDAMFFLWKDHCATQEAVEFNKLSHTWNPDYTRFQGDYSSEWFWAKIAYAGRRNPGVRQATWSWIELCDWIPLLLTGNTDNEHRYRSQCAASHKALWNSRYGGLPSREFLVAFDAYAAGMHDRYTTVPRTSDSKVGVLDPNWACKLGLPLDVVVGGSSLDAHAGAVGAGIGPGVLVSVLGTSAVHMTVLSYDRISDPGRLTDYCGLAEDSIIPGFWGVESGQAAFGDVLSWFADLLSPFDRGNRSVVLQRLDALIAGNSGVSNLIGLEWLNGRRYPNGSDYARGALVGLDLSSDAASLYSSLTDSILFGIRRIVMGMQEHGLFFDSVVATGGIARKSEVLMQRYASILNLPVLAVSQTETCAVGASMYGAVACGRYPDLQSAQKRMCSRAGRTYLPDPLMVGRYENLYARYLDIAAALEKTWSR